MTDKTCAYEGCHEPVNSPHDDEYCIFHAPVEKKGEYSNFHNKIMDKQSRGDCNYKGFIFPKGFVFREGGRKDGGKISFLKFADFKDAEFYGDAYFSKAQFAEDADFTNARFFGCSYFNKTKFSKYADFSKAQFLGSAYFDRTCFDDRVLYESLKIKKLIEFTNISLAEKARFYFNNPDFALKGNECVRVVFDVVKFNPFAVYFENIGLASKVDNVCLIFRYCQLKDVYFTNNNMFLFSFYKSSYDEAMFISSKWGAEKDRILIFPYLRKNVIMEEKFLGDLSKYSDNDKAKKFREDYEIEDFSSHKDIAALYRRMKTALDNTKDYQQASWFYFNEFEMKRKAMEEEIESDPSKIRQVFNKLFSKYILYFLYKVLAGYGEKPMWSFYWLGFFLGVFTLLNYLIGVHPVINGPDISPNLWDSFIFALYRILPTNYIPYTRNFYVPPNFWGLLVPFLNTLVLIIMIAFIGIGLKRHFRRF